MYCWFIVQIINKDWDSERLYKSVQLAYYKNIKNKEELIEKLKEWYPSQHLTSKLSIIFSIRSLTNNLKTNTNVLELKNIFSSLNADENYILFIILDNPKVFNTLKIFDGLKLLDNLKVLDGLKVLGYLNILFNITTVVINLAVLI